MDFDNENKAHEADGSDSGGDARSADRIDGGENEYDKKYDETYSRYDFKSNRTEDNYGEYNENVSYADQSANKKQFWHGTRTGGWTSFFRGLPYPMICVVIYLIVGFVCNAWHPAWIIFLTVPAYYSMVEFYATSGKVRFPLFTIVVIGYLLMGFLGNLWHPGWIIFLAWPLYFAFFNLMKIKQTRLIIYTFVCVAVYVTVGLALNLWHPTWIIFLTIPIFESLYISAIKLIKEKKEEHREEKAEKTDENKTDNNGKDE